MKRVRIQETSDSFHEFLVVEINNLTPIKMFLISNLMLRTPGGLPIPGRPGINTARTRQPPVQPHNRLSPSTPHAKPLPPSPSATSAPTLFPLPALDPQATLAPCEQRRPAADNLLAEVSDNYGLDPNYVPGDPWSSWAIICPAV